MQKKWSPAEEQFIRVNWPVITASKITKALNEKFGTDRTEASIDGKVDRMNLPKKREYSRHGDINAETELEIQGRLKTLELLRIKNLIEAYSSIKIKVKTSGPNAPDKILDGVVIQKNNSFIAVKTKEYIECCRYTDFYTGKAVII